MRTKRKKNGQGRRISAFLLAVLLIAAAVCNDRISIKAADYDAT